MASGSSDFARKFRKPAARRKPGKIVSKIWAPRLSWFSRTSGSKLWKTGERSFADRHSRLMKRRGLLRQLQARPPETRFVGPFRFKDREHACRRVARAAVSLARQAQRTRIS